MGQRVFTLKKLSVNELLERAAGDSWTGCSNLYAVSPEGDYAWEKIVAMKQKSKYESIATRKETILVAGGVWEPERLGPK